VEDALQRLVSDLLNEAHHETTAEVAAAEQRLRTEMDAGFARVKAEESEEAMREARKSVNAEADRKIQDALAAAETRMKAALVDPEARAAVQLKDQVSAARVREREIEMAGVTRLLESVRGLDGATSLSEVLDALAQGAAREAARAAVVVLRSDRVHGWRLSGFGPRDTQPKSIDLALGDSGVIGLAVGAARAVTTRDGQPAADGPGFEHLPPDRMGLAVPVMVGGRVVAIVYADSVPMDGHERIVPSGWPELIEILARHAGRVLEAMAAQKTAPPAPKILLGKEKPGAGAKGATGATGATGAAGATGADDGTAARTMVKQQAEDTPLEAARRIARLLVSEIRLYHEPVVNEARRAGNILARLGPEIARARAAFHAQVPDQVKAESDVFQQELVRTLAGGDATLLGSHA
jgi:GAF domain